MDAPFDPSQFDEIPDVLPPGEAATSAPPSRAVPPPAGPPRAAVRKQRALALAAGLVWLFAQAAAYGFRPDLRKLGAVYQLVVIGLPPLLASGMLALAVWPGRDGLGARPGTIRAWTVASLIAAAAAVLFMPPPFDFTPHPGADPPVTWALVCADVVLVMGAIPLVLATVTWRRAFAVAAPERTFALGAACGLGALSAMHLCCDNVLTLHMAVGHLLPAVLLALAAGLFLHRFTRA